MSGIRSHILWHKLYAVITILGIIIIYLFVPGKKIDALPAFALVLVAITTLISGIMSAVIVWMQEDGLKKLITKEIKTHKDFLEKQIEKAKDELVHISFGAIDAIKQNPNNYIQKKLSELNEIFDINDIISPFVQNILRAEFQKQLKELIESINPLYETTHPVDMRELLTPHKS